MKILFLSLSLALLTLSCGPSASKKSSSADSNAAVQLVPSAATQERDSITHNFYDTTVCVLYPKRTEPKIGNAFTRELLRERDLSICDYDIPIYGDVQEIWIGDKANDHGFGVGFDARGNITDISYSSDYISDSTDELCRSYTYDDADRLIGQEAWCYNGHIKQDLDAKYDSKGNITEMNIWASLWKTGRATYKYDSMGNIIEKVHPYSNNTTYKYDSHSNMIMKLEYDDEGKRVTKTTYKYDANDNLVMSLNYDSNDSLSTKHLYYYNSKGDMCKVATYYKGNKGDAEIISDIEYDSRGNLIKCGQEMTNTITYSK